MAFDIESLSSITSGGFSFSPYVSKIVFYFSIILIIAIIGGIFLLIWHMRLYRYRIIIIADRANETRKVFMDKARKIIEGSSVKYFRLWKLKRYIPPIENKYINAFGNKDLIFMHMDTQEKIAPIEFNAAAQLLSTIPFDIDFWKIQEYRKKNEAYNKPEGIAKYSAAIIWAGGILSLIIIAFIFLKVIDKINIVNSGLAETAKLCIGGIKQVGGGSI